MKIPNPIVLDFETDPIAQRPEYPPKPVGLSVMLPGAKPHYYSWGHPTENNCDVRDAKRAYATAMKHPDGVLFHNGKFDTDVGETHFGIALPPSLKIHDTMFLLFLNNPHSLNLKLKPAAKELLNMPPEELDLLRDWAIANKLIRANQKEVGHLISQAPGKLVGNYANGDTIRTCKLFKKLYPSIVDRGMLAAYQREQRLMPHLLANERQGMRVDVTKLRADFDKYEKEVVRAEKWIRTHLKSPGLNLDSDRDLADALMRNESVSEWTYTPGGQPSVSKKNLLPEHFVDPRLRRAMGYHSRLGTCMGTFMRPWLEQAESTKGLIYTNWRQVKGSGGDGTGGARSGRQQSSPNFQNIPKTFYGKGDGYEHPAHIKELLELPLMRSYVLPDKPSHWIGRRDYNQQELRILAHFEDGELLQSYLENPYHDVHKFVMAKIKEIVGIELARGPVKILNFGMLYGMGTAKLAAGIKQDMKTAKRLKVAQMSALSGVRDLDKELKQRGKAFDPIYTWGGREYICEQPKFMEGRWQTFEYKLLNYLVQGSAADCTKEAQIRYCDMNRQNSRFMLTVHDEIDISVPKKALKEEMLQLREVMMSVEFDLPMVSDGEYGPRWSELQDLKEPPFNWSPPC